MIVVDKHFLESAKNLEFAIVVMIFYKEKNYFLE